MSGLWRNFAMHLRAVWPSATRNGAFSQHHTIQITAYTMKRIVLLRHGQSQWNLENRFTGWTDVDLTEQGLEEARKAGELLKKEGFKFGMAYTSYLKRAIKTLNNVIDAMNADWIPVQKSWRLNEKHYGMLQGLNKSETAAKYGEEQVLVWRRSFDIAPDPIAEDDKERNAKYEDRYAEVADAELPRTESLKDCIVAPFPTGRRNLPHPQEGRRPPRGGTR